MTSMSNIVKAFESEVLHANHIRQWFSLPYCRTILRLIDVDKVVETIKSTIEMFILRTIKRDVLNYKIYVYKNIDTYRCEIMLKPKNTSTVVVYFLDITESGSKLERKQ